MERNAKLPNRRDNEPMGSNDEISLSEPASTNPPSPIILTTMDTTNKPIENVPIATASGDKISRTRLSDDESVNRSSVADDEIEEDIGASISEHFSFDDSNVESASGHINAINLKKRQLFDIGDANDDDDDDDMDGAFFKMNDAQLSGGHIAQHFRVSEQSEPASEHIDDSLDDNALSRSKSQPKSHAHSEPSRINSNSASEETNKNSRNIEELQQQQRPSSQSSIKLDASNAESGTKGGILEEGVILINNDQVSLTTLKSQQLPQLHSAPVQLPMSPAHTSTTTQNTTNDISDILADDDELSLSHLVQEKAQIRNRIKSRSTEQVARKQTPADVGQKCRSLNSSFRMDADECKAADSSYEEDHSIEEVVVSNASIDVSQNTAAPNRTGSTDNLSFHNLTELESNIDINNESQMNRILADTIDSLPRAIFGGSQEPLDSLDDTESQINKILADTVDSIPDAVFAANQSATDSFGQREARAIVRETIGELPRELFEHQPTEPIDSLDYMSDGISELKERILERSDVTTLDALRTRLADSHGASEDDDQPELLQPPVVVVVKQMEKVDYSKEALEDISEESVSSLELQPSNAKLVLGAEMRKILQKQTIANDADKNVIVSNERNDFDETNASSFDSVVSLNMLQVFENKIKELEDIVATKDVCLTALNMQLESVYRRDSLKDVPPALDSCSMATSSTEYRTYQDDYANHKALDFHTEINEREHIIEQLTDSLQQSMHMREQLQTQSDRLTTEVIQLRKQLADSVDVMRRPHWMRDGSVGGGQRISEISIDLVSESDLEDVEFKLAPLTDGEEKPMRAAAAKDRQFVDASRTAVCDEPPAMPAVPILKEIEQFQRYLSADELRIFFMVQNKFNDYLKQEVETVKNNCDAEIKMMGETFETEKHDRATEMNRLRQLLAKTKGGTPEILELRRELKEIHGREMEDLRTYFERKCSDLEKQYSEEIFSQHSHRHSNDTGSELSDQEVLPDEKLLQSQQATPKRKNKFEILASPTHRKITPTSIGDLLHSASKRTGSAGESRLDDQDPELTAEELESFYRDKIAEINKNHEDTVRMLKFRLKRFEVRTADDEFMPTHVNVVEGDAAVGVQQPAHVDLTNADDEDDRTAHKDLPASAGNDSNVIGQIVEEYEQRLKEQVAMAKEDIVNALEEQIQALLSETATDDSQWPPELILLREKLTAKSQLEIAQLQIKHKEEMDRVKSEFEIQLSRKVKRQTTFDGNRDLDQIVQERDNLRELCSTFRWLLSELAKCVTVCEEDLNKTLFEELHRHGIETAGGSAAAADDANAESMDKRSHDGSDELNNSCDSDRSSKQRLRFVPDVSGILHLIEDQSLLDYVGHSKESSFNLNECVDRLKHEAMYLLELSENLCKKNKSNACKTAHREKDDSCEEEDGLKSKSNKRNKLEQASSLNENLLSGVRTAPVVAKERKSLPSNCLFGAAADDNRSLSSNSELTGQLHDLRNRLLLSENERQNLRTQLDDTLKKHDNLAEILSLAKDHLEHLEAQKEDISEGYGISQLKSPSRHVSNTKTTYSDLQNTARSILNGGSATEDGTLLLQQIEDFCSKLDRFVEEEKQCKNDLQQQIEISISIIGLKDANAQIDAAYKQKKATSKLLEQQAFEWQQERDDFTREIEKLNAHVRDKEKECVSHGHVIKEVDAMEQQIKEMNTLIAGYEEKKQKLECDQKAYIDKIFVLRDVIADLETQLETKALNEHVLSEKVKVLESYVNSQTHANESLHDEVESLKTEFATGYREQIAQLEEQLRSVRPSAEQSLLAEQFSTQLKQIEISIDRKTRNLESLHSDICSASCSTPSEDVSVVKDTTVGSPAVPTTPRSPHQLPVDNVQRIVDKLLKHTRAEEAAVKRIRDLEMQIATVRTGYDELQHDRDVLQEKMSEQILRISSLQSRLDEQRHRAEELHRQGTSDLNLKVYDLQTQLTNVQEKLTAREKQIVTLKDHLEQSKVIIDRLEADLTLGPDGTDNKCTKFTRLEAEVRAKNDEIQRLKEKMRNEMINKLALPDLMETMLSEKNEEIEQLREQLTAKQTELQQYHDGNDKAVHEWQTKLKPDVTDGKLSARTLSDIVSLTDYDDEPDIIRKAADTNVENIVAEPSMASNMELSSKFFANAETTKPSLIGGVSSVEPSPIEAIQYSPNVLSPFAVQTPALQPRQINFSLTEEFASKPATGYLLGISSTLPKTSIDEEQSTINYTQEARKFENDVDNLKAALELVNTEKSMLSAEMTKQREIAASLTLDVAAKSKLVADIIAEKKGLQVELNEIKVTLNKLQVLQSEVKSLQEDLSLRNQDFDDLRSQFDGKNREFAELLKRVHTLSNDKELLQHQVQSLSKTISHKDEILAKHEKNSLNFAHTETRHLERINSLEQEVADLKRTIERLESGGNDPVVAELRQQLDDTKTNLFEVMIDYEKSQLDLKQSQQQRAASPSSLPTRDYGLAGEQLKCRKLEKEIEILREALLRHDQNSSPKHFQLDDIAESVEKELNYSAQLDSNILKAIESDELNSDEDNLAERLTQNMQDFKRAPVDDDVMAELRAIKQKYEIERSNCLRLQRLLDAEKRCSGSLQEQDANVIDAMRLRLEAAMEQEVKLQELIDAERAKTERLSAQLSVHQRSLSRENSLLLLKSPPESPRRQQRSNDVESELVNRLQSEVKLLTSQNDREKERVTDMERVMEREKHRVDKELADRRDYGDRIKREMDRVMQEKQQLANDLEHAQERLSLSSREIESLEARISTLQEAESRRASRRGKERSEFTQNAVDVQELRLKLVTVERERDALLEKVVVLRGDIERGAQREAQLTDALVKEHSGDGIMPQQFLQKLSNIVDNTKEYRQMAETLQFLTEERQVLQQHVEELELRNRAFNRDELEKRANHLFGKYLRVESFRKALVHQKRYLVIMLQTYQENEAKALALLNGKQPPKQKLKSFKSAVLVIIAIERMKYIVKRWQTGKRVGSEAIFSHQLPRRSASATTNNWVRPEQTFAGQSPPSRDRSSARPYMPLGRQLLAPSLIAECSERLESVSASTRATSVRDKWT